MLPLLLIISHFLFFPISFSLSPSSSPSVSPLSLLPFLLSPSFLPPPSLSPLDTQTRENMDRSFLIIDPMDFNTFSKCWFEVAVRHPSKLESPAYTVLDPSPSFNSPLISLSNFGNQPPFYMDFDKPSEILESKCEIVT